MNISPAGRDFIERWEGLRLTAYKPTPEDRWTVGYGSTVGVWQGMTITPFEASQMLTTDLAPVEAAIDRLVKIDLLQYEADSLCALIFNVGIPAFADSTALKDLNIEYRDGFRDQAFGVNRGFVHQNGRVVIGLVNRRRAEEKLFFNGDYGGETGSTASA